MTKTLNELLEDEVGEGGPIVSTFGRSSLIKKYRKKPIVIEAIQWTGNNWSEIGSWMNSVKTNSICHTNLNEVWINTLEGIMVGGVSDYIIKGITGEFYPCKADIFEASYIEVIDE